MNLRDKILAAPDIATTSVDVPEWIDEDTGKPITVKVRALDLGQRNDALTEARDPETKELNLTRFYTRIVQVCTLDPDTEEPIFLEGDVVLLERKSPGAQDRIAKAALAASGLDEKGDVDKAVAGLGEGSSATESGELST